LPIPPCGAERKVVPQKSHPVARVTSKKVTGKSKQGGGITRGQRRGLMGSDRNQPLGPEGRPESQKRGEVNAYIGPLALEGLKTF